MKNRRIIYISLCSFTIYAALIAIYLFLFESRLPHELQGTSADPNTFLTTHQLFLSEQYSKIKNLLYFLTTPFEWLLYLFILVIGISTLFNEWARKTSRFKSGQTIIYLAWLTIFTTVITYPINYFHYFLSKKYNISTQSFSAWMRDELIDFWINFGLTILIVIVLYWLISKSKKWWLYAWILLIPFTLIMTFLQPVIIDPLYNDFYPLKNKELEQKILTMAEQANIPAEHVYEVNQSTKTNALNAYVTGIGSNARIVLWDTTLKQLDDDEILFIMAHEIAHYKKNHIYIGIARYLLISLVGLFILNKLALFIIKKFGPQLQLTTLQEVKSLPLILVLLSMLLFFSSPLTSYISRQQESSADSYALQLTNNPDAAISTFQKLAKASLNEVNPPSLVKFFRYTHPPISERISTIENEK